MRSSRNPLSHRETGARAAGAGEGINLNTNMQFRDSFMGCADNRGQKRSAVLLVMTQKNRTQPVRNGQPRSGGVRMRVLGSAACVQYGG